MKIIIPILAIILGAVGVTQFTGWPKARLTAHIIGEDGKPISGVSVVFGFSTKNDYESIDKVQGTTDSNGNFTGEGYTGGILGVEIRKEGYYLGWLENTRFQKDDGMGHWQPWDQTYTTILRKIGTPTSMYVRKIGIKVPGAIKDPCGFDLEDGDWVAPYGTGKIPDFVVTMTNAQYRSYSDYEASATISFTNPEDGIQAVQLPKEFENGWFKWPRQAPESGYQPTVETRRAWLNPPNELLKAIQPKNINTAGEVQTYFFRVRTVKRDGKIISALYGKIKDGITIGTDTTNHGYISFTYYLNPTSLDRNLEWEPKKNLTPIPKDVTQQVHDP